MDQTFAAKYITDVSASYRFLNRLTVAFGADNVLDVYPDANNDAGDPTPSVNRGGNANFGIFPFNSLSPFGFNGRYIYTRLSFGL